MTNNPMPVDHPDTLEAAVAELVRFAHVPAGAEQVRDALSRVLDALDRHCRDAEEGGGMFDVIEWESPHLGRHIERLRGEHEQVRDDADHLISAVRREVAAGHSDIPATLSIELEMLAGTVERHHRHTADIIHEAFVAETGSMD